MLKQHVTTVTEAIGAVHSMVFNKDFTVCSFYFDVSTTHPNIPYRFEVNTDSTNGAETDAFILQCKLSFYCQVLYDNGADVTDIYNHVKRHHDVMVKLNTRKQLDV